MFLFAGITACVMAFYHRYHPETKGRSLEDMLAYFEGAPPGGWTINIAPSPTQPSYKTFIQ